ncbi:PepSY-associated TM helix domain-containing protein [Flaviaesturariibacter amylovorans]
MKVFFRRIHLYLSFAAGLVILVACLTGALLVFEKDIQMATSKERYYVAPGGTPLSTADLLQRVKDSFPDAKINGVKWYAAADRSVEVSVAFPKKKEGAGNAARKDSGNAVVKTEAGPKAGGKETPKAGAKPERQPGFTIFVNPYTGVILEKYSYRETSFYTVFALHRWLLGGEDSVGKLIVGISTLLFLFILITGIVLWWPRTRKIMQQRLSIKWGASWKRVNHDLHLVLGFYSALFLFVFAFTGLAWSFEWFNKGIYTVTGSPEKAPPPPKSAYALEATAQKPAVNYDGVLQQARALHAGATFYNVQTPKDATDPVTVQLLPKDAVHESATHALYFDRYTGASLGDLAWKERSLGARVRGTFKPVHTGSIWGLPSKIIAFIVCLFGVTFPITGTIMWWNRTRKKKARKAGKPVPVDDVEEELA